MSNSNNRSGHMMDVWAQDNDDDTRLKEHIGNLRFTQSQLNTNINTSNYEEKLAKEILAKKRAKENEELLKLRNPINKIIASEEYYTIPVDTESRTSSNDYIFLRNTNPRIAIFVKGFKHNTNDNDGIDNIYSDLCETNLCYDPTKLYIKLSTESDWNIGNRGKKFNKLIKEYDNYKKVNGNEARYAWRMRNVFTGSRRFMEAGKKTKRKKRKHVKSKKARKTRKHVKSRKQRKSRRKN